MSALAAPELQLPWESTGAEDKLFRNVLGASLLILLLVAIAVPLLPLADLPIESATELPPPLARVLLEKQQLPPPEPVVAKPRPKPKIKPRPVEPKPVAKTRPRPKAVPVPSPAQQLEKAREQAKIAGVLAFQDDLQELRDSVDTQVLDQSHSSRGQASAAQVDRSIITGSARSSSGGIATTAVSRDAGGPALSGRETTRVESGAAGSLKRAQNTGRAGQLGGRGDDTIRRVMDRNKGAIFAIYNRALRRDPLLQGKLVFEMVIGASGQIVELSLLSSELSDDALTRKILSRIRAISFGSENVAATRVNYSFDFLPYS